MKDSRPSLEEFQQQSQRWIQAVLVLCSVMLLLTSAIKSFATKIGEGSLGRSG